MILLEVVVHLYTLWSADLITDLKTVPGTEIYMYADDTATLSSGASIEQAERGAQQAADVISGWAARWKMRIAGEKTQALALSQWARDATHLKVKVAGAEVTAGTSLRLLGVTFDRLLHFGAHCSELRRKVRPRIAHLRCMTGRSWGLNETAQSSGKWLRERGPRVRGGGPGYRRLRRPTWSWSTESCVPRPGW